MKKIRIAAAIIGTSFAAASYAHDKSVKEQLGEVKFEVSCAAPAKAKFQRAMALFHSFDWRRGKTEFEEIATLDPKCGMAYWGLAMVMADNPFGWPVSIKVSEGAAAIAKAKEIGAATQRERDYIDALVLLYKDAGNTPHRVRAVAYEEAMEKVAKVNPADLEATILYALAVSANHDLNDKTYARPLKAAAMLEPLFISQPQHPGVAHYLIHSYDYPPIAEKGLAAAKRYSVVAADAAHAQHMPSHIFTRVGLWRESVASNKASAATDVGVKAQTPHAWDYMVYAYLQLGDDAAAEKVWAEASALKPVTHQVAFGEAFGMAAIPSRLALERGRWAEATKVGRHPAYSDVAWKNFPQAESLLYYARGLGTARSGDAAGARKEIEGLRAIHATLTERKLGYWVEQTEIQAAIVTAWALRAEGKNDEALAAMRAAADREDATEKHAVVPGPMIPARELLGDLLMELGRPADALAQYEASIGKEPNRFRGLYGAALAAERSGDKARARVHYEKLASVTAGVQSTRPELARLRQQLASN
jgi:tetratricopeptide (TPR) repeat protein